MIFGKSLVGGSTTGDVFEDVVPGAIPFRRTAPSEYQQPNGVSLELGGPWNFYAEFWRIHNLKHLADLLPVAEMAIRSDVGYLYFPLIIRNNTDKPQEVTITSASPEGWSDKNRYNICSVPPGQVYSFRSLLAPADTSKEAWREITWNASVGGHSSGSVTLRIHMGVGAMPQ